MLEKVITDEIMLDIKFVMVIGTKNLQGKFAKKFSSARKIVAVKDATYTVAKRKPEKLQTCRHSNPNL